MASDRPPSRSRMPIGLMVIGSEMVSFTLVGLLLDYALKTMPGFTIGLTLLGFVAAFTQLVRMARKMGQPGGSGGPGDANRGPQ